MHVLGIKTWGHDTGAALLSERDGEISCIAIAEARLNREKTSGRFPVLSIDYCLSAAGLTSMEDCDIVVVDRLNEALPPEKRALERKANPNLWPDQASLDLELNTRWPAGKTHFVNHIDAHAASTYFASPFEEAAILVVEGGFGIYHGEGARFTPIDRVGYNSIAYRDGTRLAERGGRPFNISKIYNMTTKALGFGWSGAGKTMGLAAYGGTVPKMDRLKLNRDHCLDPFFDQYEFVRAKTKELRKFFERDPDHLSEPRINAARETQDVFIEVMRAFADRSHQMTGSRNLAIAGGSALSCVANRAIIESGVFDQVFIQPGASDEGIPLGCALLGWHHIAGQSARWHLKDAYLGRPYGTNEIDEAIAASGCEVTDVTPEAIAKRIAEGQIIGRFAGRSEYGPRALGNRSILADPRDPKMRDRINGTIKHREMFRPFAPSCLADKVNHYFTSETDVPFMLVAADVRDEFRGKLPSITHVDGTCRPQGVTRDSNPGYHAILEALAEETGYGVVLNTSFNDNDEPICETPLDAIISFLKTNLDGLLMENRLVLPPADPSAVLSRLTARRMAGLTSRHDSGTRRLTGA